MTIYAITNQTSGHFFGYYEADNEAAALDKLARDAGYSDYDEACDTVGGRGELYLKEVADWRGLPHFASLADAITHYAPLGIGRHDIAYMLARGEIALGLNNREVR